MSDYFKPMRRTKPEKILPSPIVAYDFETTRIPRKRDFTGDELRVIKPRYLTAYGDMAGVEAYGEVASYDAVAEFFYDRIWRNVESKSMLCAYNANRFDLRILLQALFGGGFVLEPFVSKVSGLRGSIIREGRKRCLLLDPIAMLGLQCDLRTFLSVFAPDYPKGELDFEKRVFNPKNPAHVLYARRDSEALYRAMLTARKTVEDIAKERLRATVGALAIRAFMQAMPRNAVVPALRPRLYEIVRRAVMRGGFVFSRRFRGPVWTYDLNQAYAFAMRNCDLPCGRALPVRSFASSQPGFYKVKLMRCSPSPVPYMVRDSNPPYRMRETYGAGCVTWLTSDEVALLNRHGWTAEFIEGYAFERSFRMKAFVDRLEDRRRKFPKDHPVNVVCKAIGCNAYGKTLQEPTTMRYVLSRRAPKGGFPVVESNEAGDPVEGFWVVPETRDTRRQYERPQLGAFITAFVRCVLFDAIMQDPDAFVKADTDSVSFTRPQKLTISSWKYGAWKCESAGDFHIVVAKKVYWSSEKTTAKGMRVRDLRRAHMERWYKGDVPLQNQVQLQSWKGGVLAPSYRRRPRHGTAVDTGAAPLLSSPRHDGLPQPGKKRKRSGRLRAEKL